eukprot:4281652-Pyramimonas_sp.AAC.1
MRSNGRDKRACSRCPKLVRQIVDRLVDDGMLAKTAVTRVFSDEHEAKIKASVKDHVSAPSINWFQLYVVEQRK